jgi:sigma-E factor negative regulatory protein RseA
MSDKSHPDVSLTFEALSALADGQADDAQAARVLAAWRNDPQVRARWQAYHLAGDAMRSDVPLVGQSSDEIFLNNLRKRLSHEPVVLAPFAAMTEASSTVAAAPQRQWLGPLAMAASFVALMSGLVGLIQSDKAWPGGGSDQVATSSTLNPSASADAFQASARVSPWPVDGSWTSALASGLSPGAPNASLGAPRVSFGANARQGAGTQVVYAIAVREEQLDAFWAQLREQQANGRSLSMPAGAVMPVFVIHSPLP